jgi:hypothetical protein
MRKIVVSLVLALTLLALFAIPALAAEGGKPAAHGLTGAEFGAAVSANAPIADHVSNSENVGGKPAAHGLTGAEFGAAVSANAPIADHVSNK